MVKPASEADLNKGKVRLSSGVALIASGGKAKRCCCPKDEESSVSPCDDCGEAQPSAVVTTDATGWPCEADGTYDWDIFIDNLNDPPPGDGAYCSWRWELDNGGLNNWNLVVLYYKAVDRYDVYLYDLVLFEDLYVEIDASLDCVGGDITGTISVSGVAGGSCDGDTAEITFG